MQVHDVLGEPDASYAGRGHFIPFFRDDGDHTEWIYRGRGKVIFSVDETGALEVIRVVHNPNEMM